MNTEQPGPHGRIASLDGMRAVSVFLVLLGHLRGTVGFPSALVPRGLAEFGVRAFFVISGFLITRLLLAEWKRTGTISIRDFYVRRVYRIFPAFYAFLAVVLGLAVLGIIRLQPFDALTAATYTVNYHHDRSWWVGHLWSLAVEEQFYLLWPVLLAVASPRRGVWIAGAAVLAGPFVRIGVWALVPSARAQIGESFPTVCDALATGCLLTCLQERLDTIPAYHRLVRSRWFLLVPVLAASATVALRDQVALSLGLVPTLCNVTIALSIDRWTRFVAGPVGRFLNWRPVAFVGTLSYSLYLWQQLFLNRHSTALVSRFPLNLLLAAAAACASYYLIERRFLAMRSRRAPASVIAVADVSGRRFASAHPDPL
jgi:peptidoglycan/LPS O-acetylase OafA/YrhL